MLNYSGRTSKYKIFGLFVAVYFLFAALKPWFDIFMGIPHQLITSFQLGLCLIAIFLFISKKSFVDILTFVFAVYVFLRFVSEIVVLSFDGLPAFEVVGAAYSAVRLIMFCGLLLVIVHYKQVESVNAIRKIVLGYFLLTLLYSVLQHPMLGNFQLLTVGGGNITSANGLGVFRANGGVGGTVIAYANFLLAVSWIIFYSHFTNRWYHRFLKLCLLLSVFLCFSRSVFLCLLSMYFVNLLFKKQIKVLLVFGVVSLSLAYYLGGFIKENYIQMIGDSDTGRVGGWVSILEGNSFLELIMGSQVGQNTGLFLGGLAKNGGGDSFLIGTLNDFGLVGLLMFLLVVSRVLTTFVNVRYSTICGIFVSFVLMTFVNSGFEKLLVMLSFCLALIIIRNNPSRVEQVKTS
jgi:hypothetical protein